MRETMLRPVLTSFACAMMILPLASISSDARQSLRKRSPAAQQAQKAEPAAIGPIVVAAGTLAGADARIIADISDIVSPDLGVAATAGDTESAKPDANASDLAIVPAQALSEMRRTGGKPMQLVARLYNAEVHLFATSDIQTVEDLGGRPIAIDSDAPGLKPIAERLFADLGMRRPVILPMGSTEAVTALERGEVAGILVIGAKPLAQPAGLAEARAHLVPIPWRGGLQDEFYPTRIEASDYPEALTSGKPVETISTPMVLAVFDAPKGSARYKRAAEFSRAFFNRAEKLTEAGHHPKWREVNFAAEARGWQRFQPAAERLAQAPLKAQSASLASTFAGTKEITQ